MQSEKEIKGVMEYFKINSSRSRKGRRLFLIPKCYELKRLKANEESSILRKE